MEAGLTLAEITEDFATTVTLRGFKQFTKTKSSI